ncbi:acyltransferase family protein [Paenibacillus sp. JSM ZJ436]|uniref:acyltransferase family protein n=1 Tax=Paenibacillus sp. JSM ZJ436 TaxID=3376190 RepID=UPI0037A69DE5
MRKYYIDFIRVIAIILLIPFHTARIYDYYPFYIKGDESMLLQLFAVLLSQWRMPILFLVSGVGTYFLLRSRSNRAFLRDRLKRLLIPFIFAVLVIVPPQGYYAALSQGILAPGTSYWEYYPSFFTIDLSHIDGFTGTFTPAHMWFILFLVLFSLLGTGVFRWLQRQKNLLSAFAPSGLLYLLIIPIYATDLALAGTEFNPLYYFTFFLYGAWLVKEPELERMIVKERTRLLILSIISMSAVLLYYGLHLTNGFTMPQAPLLLVQSVTAFSWIFAFIGYAKMYINKEHKWITSLNNKAFTIYILHQTLIVILGYYLHEMSMPMGIKFALISILTLIAIALLYKLVIKRFKLIRLLFGAK